MQNLVDREALREIITHRGGPSVSVYAPIQPAGGDTKQDPIRLKNLLNHAEEMLADEHVRAPEIRGLLAPAREKLEDRLFWSSGGLGVAMFLSAGEARIYKVPFGVDEDVVVNSRYYASPLMPLFVEDNRFYVLALSRDRAAFYQATPHDIREVALEHTPMSLREALPGEEWDDRVHSWHSSRRDPSGLYNRRGGVAPIAHGQGEADEFIKNETLRFFQVLDRGVFHALRNESAPLVAACVEYEFPLWERANTYRHLVTRWIEGNPDGAHPNELRDRAWEIVRPIFEHERWVQAERYREFQGTGRASDDLAEIAASAYYGRVDSLFVSTNGKQWGRFDPDTGKAEVHDEPRPMDEPLADLAAFHTFLHGGKVWALPPDRMLDGREAVAVYRYALTAVY